MEHGIKLSTLSIMDLVIKLHLISLILARVILWLEFFNNDELLLKWSEIAFFSFIIKFIIFVQDFICF